MYTGKREKPCCLCGDPSVSSRLDLPPRAITEMRHGDPIAWRDVEGEVSIYFCADDWETVRELALEIGMSPLSRCNAAHASFDLREDFEALTDDVREEPDQRAVEDRMLAEADETLAREDDNVEDRDLVEARVVRWALADARAEG
jgi:hypothetical protein